MKLIDNKALQRYIVFNLVVSAIIGFSAYYILNLLDLRNFDTLAILFMFCLILCIVIVWPSFYILKKKGVEVYSAKNMLIMGLAPMPNIFIPIWIDPELSFKVKGLITIGSLAFAIANFYAVHHGGKRLRKQIGIETEEDKWEKEREEKVSKGRETTEKNE